MATTGEDVQIKFGASIEGLTAGVNQVKEAIEGLSAPINSFMASLGGIGEAVLAAFATERVTDWAKEIGQVALRTTNLAQSVGLSAEEMQGFGTLLEGIGGSAESATRGLIMLEAHLSQGLSNAVSPAGKALTALGITHRQLDEAMHSTGDLLELMRSKFSQYQDGPNKTALGHALLGRSMQELFPIINMTREQFEEYEARIKETGADMSGPMVAAAAETGKNFNFLGLAVEGISKTLFGAFEPAIDLVVHGLTSFLEGITANIREGGNLSTVLAVLVTAFDTLLATITTVVYGIMQLWQVFAGLVQTIEVGCRTMITALVSVATAANHLAKGEFSQILPSLEKPWEDAAAQLENIWVTRLHNMQAEGESFVNTIKGLFSNLQLSVAHGLSLDFHEGEHAPKDTRPKAPALPEKDGKGAAGKGEDRVSEWRNELQQQLMAEENYFNDSKKEELAFWQDKLQLTAAGSKEQFAVESTIYQLKKSLAKEAARDALTAVGTEQKVSDERFARYRAAYAGLASLGKISATEQVTLEKALLDEQWVYDQAYFEKKRAAAAKDTAELKKLDDEALLAYQKMLSEKQGLDIKAAEASKKAWEDAVAPIQRAFDTAFQGVIQGTQTLKQAFAKMMQSIVLEIAQAQLKKVFENQLKDIFQGLTAKLGLDKIFGGLFGKSDIGGAGEGALGAASKITATQLQALGAAAAAAIAKMTGQGATATPGTGTGPSVQLDQAATQFATTVQAAATQFQTTIQAAATGSSTTQQAGAASASATEAAGAAGAAATQTGAGATFASEVDAAGATFAAEAAVGGAAKGVGGILGGLVGMIPVVGPFLQGVGKIAGIFERGGIVPTAAGGWALPNFSGMTLAGLHGGEMVLPQDISQGLQGMIKSGGGGGVMNLTITAMDGASVHKVLMANAPSIMAAFNKASRNGSFPRTS